MVLADGRPGVKVRTVGNGEDCLRELQEQVFDCIVLDFNLPDCAASGLLCTLRKCHHSCPVIVVSSSRDQEVVIESMRSGSLDFVPKTVALQGDTLWRRVEQAITRHREAQKRRGHAKRRAAQLAKLAEVDPLTGLSNRRYLDRLFRTNRRKAYDRRAQISVIMLDVDHFKRVNDSHGHAFGDMVLQKVAHALQGSACEGDVVCRWGGEELVVLRPSTSLAEAVFWAENLRRGIEYLEIFSGDRRVIVTASIGVVNCPSRGLSAETISQADQAMYLAKSRGRNRVCTWESVSFRKLLEVTGAADREPPERRLSGFLGRCWDQLGPTQRDHLGPHSDRVSKAAASIGRALGLDRPTQQRLRTAALLHDLGKWIVPEDVLGKPSELSREERELVRRHAQDGAEMSIQLGADQMTAGWIRCHHNRFDGEGPPAGMRGQAIPLEARILAIADAIDAMTSERPYRSAYSLASAMGKLQRERGGQFDPVLVDTALDMLRAEVGAGAVGHGCPLAGGKGHEQGSSNGREAAAGQATFGANTRLPQGAVAGRW